MSLESFLGTWRIDETDNDLAAPSGHYINILRLRNETDLAVAVWGDSEEVVVEVARLVADGERLVTTEPAYGVYTMEVTKTEDRRIRFVSTATGQRLDQDLEDPPPLAGTWGAEDAGGSNY